VNSTYGELEELVSVDYPDAWRPDLDEGHPNPLVGEIIDRRQATTRRDTEETVLVIRTVDGAVWSLWLLGAVLQRELGDVRPRTEVAVRWLGMRPNADGVQYRSYRVALNTPAGEEDAA
jgi:hypothetical protein